MDRKRQHSIAQGFFINGDLNIGTGGGTSADPELVTTIMSIAAEIDGYDSILDGRFKGGYITRRYGRPNDGIHAIQLELSQITYMEEEPPFRFRDDLAAGIRSPLRRLLERTITWANRSRTRGPVHFGQPSGDPVK